MRKSEGMNRMPGDQICGRGCGDFGIGEDFFTNGLMWANETVEVRI